MQIGDQVRRHKNYLDIRVGTVINVQQELDTTQVNVQWGKRKYWHDKSSLVIAEEVSVTTIVSKHTPDTCICNQALPHSSIGLTKDSKNLYKLCALFSKDKRTMSHSFQELIVDRQQLIDLKVSIQNLLKIS
jgi:hypothetical protein